MKLRFASALFFGVLTSFQLIGNDIDKQSIYPVSKKSEIVLLNGSWDFKYVEGRELPEEDKAFYKPEFIGKGWGKIDVPSNWELQGKASLNYADRLVEGIGLYRTTFSLPEQFMNKETFIRFEGVLYAYELFVNGLCVGKWQSAFNSYQFDITPYLTRGGVNVMAVKVFTHTEKQTHLFDISDHWALSGIFRDVILFAVPDIHVDDVVFKSYLLKDGSASINIKSIISAIRKKKSKKYKVECILLDPNGRGIYSVNRSVNVSNKKDSIQMETVVTTPLLWTAETPQLYTLTLKLYNGKVAIQSITEKVGIREISIKDGVFMINHTAVKLKGVSMHEIHPIRGSALTDQDRKADLQLAKKANINYIRTSHYPHHPHFFELCDSMGFYVVCEIPFNFEPVGVTDNLNYLPQLLSRAEATITRNKNHPSIITWSLGNENQYAEIYKRVAIYTEQKDPTRPRCFPQAPKVFAKDWRITSDVFNVLAPHYLLPSELESLAQESKRPIIMTEYGHSLGLSTENLEESWDVVRRYPNLAGASIWMWSDQGIKVQRSVQDFLADENPDGAWEDSTTYYDGFNVYGTDGIVYSNRHPQSDYWLARKVYSPLWVMNKKMKVKPGEQNLQIEVENRFDFISLKGFYCAWTLKHFNKKLAEGRVELITPPKSTSNVAIRVSIPDLHPDEFTLALRFYDSLGSRCYETTIQLYTDKEVNYTELNRALGNGPIEAKQDKHNNFLVMTSEKSLFGMSSEGEIILQDRHSGDTLLTGLPALRVGRKPTITLAYQAKKYKNTFYWNPYLLSHPKLLSSKMTKINDGYEITAMYRWNRQEKENEYIEGNVVFNMLPCGDIACVYDLKPHGATGAFMECGLGFSLPKVYSTFRWLGEGPFVSVPGKGIYNERDIWSLRKDDIRFTGNRTKTDLAAFYKDEYSGIGFIGDKSNFGVEFVNDSIIFTSNAFVSGFGNKVNFTKYLIEADHINSIQGKFDMVILGKNSKLFNQVFLPLEPIEVEKPFLKSYGF